MADVRESVRAPGARGPLRRRQVVGVADGDGVALTYRVVAARRVTHVDFRGDRGGRDRRLRQLLDRALGAPTRRSGRAPD